MKKTARKLMSLLMVFAIVCSMVPAAMAYVDPYDIDWEYSRYCPENSDDEHDPKLYDTSGSFEYYWCPDCEYEGTLEHDWVYEYYRNDQHWEWCDNDGCDYDYNHAELVDCYSSNCYCDYGYSYYDVDLYLDTYDDLHSGDTYEYGDEIELEVYVTVEDEDGYDITDDCYITIDWSGDLDGSSSTYDEYFSFKDNVYSYAYMDTTDSYAEVTCYVTVEDEDGYTIAEDYVTWKAYRDGYGYDDIEVEATVYNSSDGYQFDDEDDEGYDSIEEQIYDAIYDLDKDFELEYVTFDYVNVSNKGELSASKNTKYYSDEYGSKSTKLLGDVVFYPDEDYEGDVTFDFTAHYYDDYYDDDGYVYGTIVFDVKDGVGQGGSILYTAGVGDTVALDEDDFEDFWDEEYPSGTLEYVTFTSVSTGYLYDNYAGGSKSWTDVESKGTKCYLDPSSRQTGLDNLTYVPGKNTTSATIRFTAHGTTGKNNRTDNVSGTVSILFVAEDVTPIEYTASGGAVTLRASDFTAKYRDVMNTSTAGTLQIQFTSVPKNGALYMGYTSSGSRGAALTSSNIKNYTFSTASNATRSIADVTYVPGSGTVTDTVTFQCYSGNQLKFIGTIIFKSADPIVINLASTSAGVTFKSTDFFNAANGDLLTASHIIFGSPSSGALYKDYDYAKGTGTRVTTSDMFGAFAGSSSGAKAISSVTYIPNAQYSGTVEIPFVASGLNGLALTGTVKIAVTATPVFKEFTDVPEEHWAHSYITRLASQGVVGGNGDGTFKPDSKLTYGEALKMLMNATGYSISNSSTGHWAQNFLTAAYSDGLVDSGTTIDLNAPISRTAVAEIAAKALGLGEAYVILVQPAPVDTTNGYVYVLYNEGILEGSTSGGVNRFKGDDTIKRSEISKIVCLVMDHYNANR